MKCHRPTHRTVSAQFLHLLVATVLISVSTGCDMLPGRQGGSGPPARPNVILISIDTLRADHLGCYGYSLATSPSTDRLAADSILFQAAMAHAPSTLPSHASIFTSLLPYHHGAFYRLDSSLPPAALTVTELLGDAGYRTAAFTGGGQLDRVWGLDQGFEIYETIINGSFRQITNSGMEWLTEELGDQTPFFLFLHTYEVHHPYTPDPWRLALFEDSYEGPLPDNILIEEHLTRINTGELKIGPDDAQHIIHAYDAEIHSMDDALGDFIQSLKLNNVYENTVIVFTSDHGEEFGEHGAMGWHSHTLYQELLHVPLIVKLPHSKHAGMVVSQVVRSIDIAPTILTAVGFQPPNHFAGVSLQRIINRKPAPSLPAVSIKEPKTRHGLERLDFSSAIQLDDWKLYDAWLFNLGTDPHELTDLASMNPDTRETLERERRRLLMLRKPLTEETVDVPEATRDQLRALGYVD